MPLIQFSLYREENVSSKQSNDFEFNSQFHDLLLPAITQAKVQFRLEILRDVDNFQLVLLTFKYLLIIL